jgi:acyl-CoA:6-aminopenicillanic acid acyl transferase
MFAHPHSRRDFLKQAALGAGACCLGGPLYAAPPLEIRRPNGALPPLAEISGKPRERGRQYGAQFRDGINTFLEREIYGAFIGHPSPKDDMRRYADASAREVRRFSPEIHDELEGMAEGSGLALDQIVLITLHEELFHKGVLPKVDHCTAVAVGPPETVEKRTYVGQTWDWMESVFGMSSMLHWRRSEGPSLLAYAFPGLWVGAGLNSAGLALCWTSADLGNQKTGARVGIPAYVLLAHLLYQESLDAAAEEAARATNAGWFTFVMGDSEGRLMNVEGSPRGIEVEMHRGRLVRVGFGSRKMTGTPAEAQVKHHGRCQKMYDLLALSGGKNDLPTLQDYFADPKHGICVGRATIDMMVFDTTNREAYLSRGPSYGADWHRFEFPTTNKSG